MSSPPKGILKKDKSRRQSRGIQWDEECIQEHDKSRGTRMKIEEPKTPYHHKFHSDSEDETHIDFQVLESKMNDLKNTQQSGEELKLKSQEDEERRREFERKRKLHYNEFKVAKGLVDSSSEESSEDEDD